MPTNFGMPFPCETVFFIKKTFLSKERGMTYLFAACMRLERLTSPRGKNYPFRGLQSLLSQDKGVMHISKNGRLCVLPIAEGLLLGFRDRIPATILWQVWTMQVTINETRVQISDFLTNAVPEVILQFFLGYRELDTVDYCQRLDQLLQTSKFEKERELFRISSSFEDGYIYVSLKAIEPNCLIYTDEQWSAKCELEHKLGDMLDPVPDFELL